MLQRASTGAATARTRRHRRADAGSGAELLAKAFPDAPSRRRRAAPAPGPAHQDCPTRSTRSATRSASPSGRSPWRSSALRARRHRAAAHRRVHGGDGDARASRRRRRRTSRGSPRASSRGSAPAATPRWRDGDLVAFDAGVVSDGYVGELGRTVVVGERRRAGTAALFRRRDELLRPAARRPAGRARRRAICSTPTPRPATPLPPDAGRPRAGPRLRPAARDATRSPTTAAARAARARHGARPDRRSSGEARRRRRLRAASRSSSPTTAPSRCSTHSTHSVPHQHRSTTT